MNLTELLNEELPAPNEFKVVPVTKNEYAALFTVGKIRYMFDAEVDLILPDAWEIVFRTGRGQMGPIGTGNVGKVFATVIAIVKNFIAKKKPKKIIFAMSDASPGRFKLYSRLTRSADKFFPGYKGKVPKRNTGDFIILKKGLVDEY